jgi:UPF0716 protein FxsA
MIRQFFWSGLIIGVLDLYLLYRIGCEWGFWPVLGILILPAWFGMRVALRQGLHCMSRIQEEAAAGRNPSQKVAEAPLILASGLLLLMPGPVSTVLGILLMIPGLRRFLASRLLLGVRKAGMVAESGTAGSNDGVFVRVVQIGGSGPGASGPTIKDADGHEVDSADEAKTKELPGGQPGNGG